MLVAVPKEKHLEKVRSPNGHCIIKWRVQRHKKSTSEQKLHLCWHFQPALCLGSIIRIYLKGFLLTFFRIGISPSSTFAIVALRASPTWKYQTCKLKTKFNCKFHKLWRIEKCIGLKHSSKEELIRIQFICDQWPYFNNIGTFSFSWPLMPLHWSLNH